MYQTLIMCFILISQIPQTTLQGSNLHPFLQLLPVFGEEISPDCTPVCAGVGIWTQACKNPNATLIALPQGPSIHGRLPLPGVVSCHCLLTQWKSVMVSWNYNSHTFFSSMTAAPHSHLKMLILKKGCCNKEPQLWLKKTELFSPSVVQARG